MKFSLIALALCSLLAPAFAAPPPNIVIFLVDDMGVMDTSVPFLTDAAGQPVSHPLNAIYRTPNMERLAARGIRFNNFEAMSVCSPSRISIMTGQNAARHRTTTWINADTNNAGPHGPPEWNWMGLNKRSVTLPRLLEDNGYRTILVGKAHFGSRRSEGADPRNLGFDVNIAGGANGAPGSYYGRQNYGNPVNGKPGRNATNAVSGLEKYHGTDTFLTEALTLEANAQVDAAVKDRQPFFLYFSHYAVHRPFDSDPRFAAHYQDSDQPPMEQAFAALIEGMDKSLGDVLDHLDRLGIADNTLIIFLGDNGSDCPLGEAHEIRSAAPLRGKKGSHYEGGTRVPFIAAWARADATNPNQRRLPIPAGVIQSQLASIDDLFPTLLAFTNTQVPTSHAVDGARLDALLSGQPDPSRPETFLMHFPHSPHRSEYWTSYRDGDWKVIYHYFPSEVSANSHYQLFNLAWDPSESNNLAEAEPVVLRRMMEALITAMVKCDAQYPVADDHVTPVKPQLP
ncbi:MAG: sulfatase [Opitutaceae bacterium]|nr:sulfatase [Opitutaceae bacterium]